MGRRFHCLSHPHRKTEQVISSNKKCVFSSHFFKVKLSFNRTLYCSKLLRFFVNSLITIISWNKLAYCFVQATSWFGSWWRPMIRSTFLLSRVPASFVCFSFVRSLVRSRIMMTVLIFIPKLFWTWRAIAIVPLVTVCEQITTATITTTTTTWRRWNEDDKTCMKELKLCVSLITVQASKKSSQQRSDEFPFDRAGNIFSI